MPDTQKNIVKDSLRCGALIFLLLAILITARGGAYILLAIAVIPGMGYGLVLMSSVENIRYPLGGILFILLSVGINIGCVYEVSRDFLRAGQYAPFRLVAYSAIGAVALSLCYDILLVRRFSLLYTIAMASALGIGASLFGAACMHLLIVRDNGEFVSTLLYLGVFSFFPLWQYLFGWNIDRHNKAVAIA